MLANALCLWIAVALSAPGVVRVVVATAPDGNAGASQITPRGFLVTPGRQKGLTERFSPSARTPVSSVSSPYSLRESSARKVRRCRAARAPRPQIQQSRSLSYLSLTLRCIAPRTGWLGGYASLHLLRGKWKVTYDPVQQARSTDWEWARPRPTHWLTNRTRPVLL